MRKDYGDDNTDDDDFIDNKLKNNYGLKGDDNNGQYDNDFDDDNDDNDNNEHDNMIMMTMKMRKTMPIMDMIRP